jgi:hypothetical protein
MTTPVTFTAMLHRLLRAAGQGRAAKTVKIYGWVVLIEGAASISSPHFVAKVRIGVSIDGPGWLHDCHRKTRNGDGTHARVMKEIERPRRTRFPFT